MIIYENNITRQYDMMKESLCVDDVASFVMKIINSSGFKVVVVDCPFKPQDLSIGIASMLSQYGDTEAAQSITSNYIRIRIVSRNISIYLKYGWLHPALTVYPHIYTADVSSSVLSD